VASRLKWRQPKSSDSSGISSFLCAQRKSRKSKFAWIRTRLTDACLSYEPGHFRICTEENVYRLLRWDVHIRRRLRAILVRQKQRPRSLSRHLQERGVSRRGAAQAAYCRRGAWCQANPNGMTTAYPNAWFPERLVSLASTWEARSERPATGHGQHRPTRRRRFRPFIRHQVGNRFRRSASTFRMSAGSGLVNASCSPLTGCTKPRSAAWSITRGTRDSSFAPPRRVWQ